MRGALTSDDLVSEILLMRTLFLGVVLVVEGDNDCRFFQAFIKGDEACCCLVSNGKENALGVADKIAEATLDGVLVVVDADFDRLLGRAVPEHVVMTDYHDMEAMIIMSGAWRRFLIEVASDQKLRKLFGRDRFAASRRELLRVASFLGVMRYLNDRDGLSLCFDSLKYRKIVDPHSLGHNPEAISDVLVSRSKGTSASRDGLRLSAKEVDVEEAMGEYCCAEDLVGIVAVALRARWGTRSAANAAPDFLACILRASFSEADFRQTHLYKDMVAWGERCGYRDFLFGVA